MLSAHSDASSPLATGQRYRINSFDLGFINILPVDMLVEIRDIHAESNELELSPFPLPGETASETLVQVARWFQEKYPSRTKENCLFKNAGSFQRLVDLGIAVLQKAPSLDAPPVSLLTTIQQRMQWPTLTGHAADEIGRSTDC